MTFQLRRDVRFPQLVSLLIGTVLGTPAGVWVLEALPPSLLKRLIGLILMAVVVIQWYGAYPEKFSGRYWGLGAGVLAGLLGGAIGTPGPPVILYAVGVAAGIRLFGRIHQARFRRLLFALLFVLGLAMCIRG